MVHVALGGESTLITEPTEENVTNAMVKLSRTGVKKVYFLEGHNERAVQGEGADARTGYGRVADALGNENYQVDTLLLAATGAVPDDADVVVVAGATRPLLAEEREALNAYLERGGALLALVDPRAKTDLVEDLRSWGVEIGEDVVIDRQLALFGRATSPFAGRYDPDHAITRGMRETTLFHVARSVSGAEDSDFTEIVFTGENSWAERDLARFYADGEAALEAEDLAGPVPIAVAGTPRLSSNGSEPDAGDPQAVEGEEAAADGGGEDAAPQARLVVFGDADFPTNEYIEAYRNRDLFLNTVNWLLGDVEAISIRPARSRASRLQLSNDQFIRIRTLSLFLVPQAIAVAGVIVWWRRRFTPAG